MAIGTRTFQETSHNTTLLPRAQSFAAGLAWRSRKCANTLHKISLSVGGAEEVQGLLVAWFHSTDRRQKSKSRKGAGGLLRGGRKS